MSIAQLKASIMDLEENVAFHDASEKGLKDELSKATAKSTGLGRCLIAPMRRWLNCKKI